MRKRTSIVAIALVIIAWTAAARRSESHQAPPPEQILTKDGLSLDQFEMQVAMQNREITPLHRELRRQELSGSTLELHVLPPRMDKETAEELAALFRQQSPVPQDRVEYFRWLDRAQEVVHLIGWAAQFSAAEPRDDGLWVELKVTPQLESEKCFGAMTADMYIETYAVRGGQFVYQGGRPGPNTWRELRPDPESDAVFAFD